MTTTANNAELPVINDIGRAFFHAIVKRDVYVQPASEDRKPGEEAMCGKLNYSMYGTRDAAQNWFEQYPGQLRSIGIIQGKATPRVFYHPQRRIRTMVHGDGQLSTGMAKELQWMRECLEKKYQVKTQILGPNKEHTQQVKILNRVVTWNNNQGLIYEADPRHVELIIIQMELDQAKAVTIPGTKEEGRTKPVVEEQLSAEDASKYRALVARCNHLAPDRPDIAFSVKELASQISALTSGD